MSSKLDPLLTLASSALKAVAPASATEARRALPIRCPPDDLRRLWDDPPARQAVLAGIPTTDAWLEVDGTHGAWGTTTTIRIRLTHPAPLLVRQTVAGKAIRRFKALAEVGEIPTTERNPSARPDAGQASALAPGAGQTAASGGVTEAGT